MLRARAPSGELVERSFTTNIDHASLETRAPELSATAWSEGLTADALGNLAHELRTPLQVLLGFLDILRDEDSGPMDTRQRRIVERMNANACELGQTLENFVTYVQAKAGAEPLIDEDLTLASIFADIEPTVEAANASKRLAVEFDLQGAPQVIRAPRRALIAIIRNLVLNAVKFTMAGSVIVRLRQVRTRGAGEVIEVTVRDTGPGLRPELFDRMSQPFAQLSQSSTRRYRGVGLGLAIVRHYVDQLEGALELRSAPGEGAQFIARFPKRFGRPLSDATRGTIPGPMATSAQVTRSPDRRAMLARSS